MLMTRYSLRFRRLLQQYCRIETDRLTYIRRNQSKLRSEKYIHSRDAITTEGAANNIMSLGILDAGCIQLKGRNEACHMHTFSSG
ncbi:uncharacterized protein LOC123313228 isoform X2 [Coccinella septempunctata]|uniref:uncharacterized protein LOC123313228 isoform X2 n=1 Tax=Coccinella septempunctata TaxID=41139 RepID=UPI001D07222D|nr:uncharacterized protein LOC123313228 isoform X2 [Coccinella septempunctata]